MPTLADLMQEIRSLDVELSEIDVPPRCYRAMIAQAEDLSEEEDY